jgi:hypothetical protein
VESGDTARQFELLPRQERPMSRVAPPHGLVGQNFAGQADPPLEVAFQRIR